MHQRALVAALVAALALSLVTVASSTSPVTIKVTDERVEVHVDGKPFTALHADKAANKLYLHPVLTASGKRVTRAFPMEKIEGESTDHPHQRGVWIGAEHLNEFDFWENDPLDNHANAGRVLLEAVSDVQSGAADGRFTIHANWVAPDRQTKIVETRTMSFRADGPNVRAIDIDLRLTAKQQVTFADNHDAILGLRLATEFEEGHGGKAVNAEGLTGWEKLRGSRSAWVDWRATVGGEDVGVAVLDSPQNFRYPTPWHVRDYALLFASPFASRDYAPTAPDFSLTLKPGDDLKLRYRILVHSGPIDVAAAFKRFAER
jgi:methane monooxygenase PmoA-like